MIRCATPSTAAEHTPMASPTHKAEGVDESPRSSGGSHTLGSYQPKAGYEISQSDGVEEVGSGVDEQRHGSFVLYPRPTVPEEGNILEHDLALLNQGFHADAFSVLGPHGFSSQGDSCLVIRAWVKDAKTVSLRMLPRSSCTIESPDEWVTMTQRKGWLFHTSFTWEQADQSADRATDLLANTRPMYEFKVSYAGDASQIEYIIRDTYSFGVSLPLDYLKLFQSGSCWHVDNLMGSHCVNFQGSSGVRFAVWAPSAVFVSLVADFNQWDGRAHPMRKHEQFGIWELFVPTVAKPGQKYGYKIHTEAGTDIVKIDPYAQEFENPPAYASVISSDDDAYKAVSLCAHVCM